MTSELDHLDIPLAGVQLIEASAGTGKTYTLTGVLLRLIVEHGLRLEQILAVTFTTAATAELRDRARRRLLEARTAFGDAGAAPDAALRRLVERQDEPQRCLERIELALQSLDQAAIFTIHGFCQRVLSEHAFRSGVAFDDELVTDQGPLLQQIADDFFRRRFCTLPPEIAHLVYDHLPTPDELAGLLSRVPGSGVHLLEPPRAADLNCLIRYREEVAEFAALWRQERQVVLDWLRDPGLSGTRYGLLSGGASCKRERKLQALAIAVEAWLGRPHEALTPPLALGLLSTSRLQGALRKGMSVAPQHRLFERCEQLLARCAEANAELSLWRQQLSLDCLRFSRQELSRRKAQRHVRCFDDLLGQVAQALSSPWGEGLALDLRRQYRAVLVDEFQDTDALQYRIFQRVWGQDPEAALFLIGDPKQAIYGFRGADLYTYLQARRQADCRHTLSENWRSSPGLIAAVNALFDGPRAFGLDAIDFQPARAAESQANPFEEGSPLTLWLLEAGQGRPINQAEAEQRVTRAVVDEIVRLGAAGTAQPEQIAVLVRTNRQGRLVKEQMLRRGLPAVLYGAGSVFESPMAFDLLQILSAVADPQDEALFLAALASDTLGVEGERIARAARGGDAELEALRARFHRYHELWRERGVIHMLRRLIAQEGVKPRLMGLADGNRRLTDLLHLAELLHQAASERHCGMGSLLQWFEQAGQRGQLDAETQQLRLESDARAVQIVTIHRSKGLEFPVVFCPFAWQSPPASRGAGLLFHDPLRQDRLTLDLAAAPAAAHAAQARREALAEQLRLLYVALTRARQRLYLAYGGISKAEESALGYLLHARRFASDSDPHTWRDELKALDDAARRQDLQQLVARSGQSIALVPLPPRGTSAQAAVTAEAVETLRFSAFRGAVARSWRIASFTSLAAGVEEQWLAEEQPGGTDELAALAEERDGATASSAIPGDIRGFPHGAQAGIFFHDLLERVDFANPLQGAWQALVSERLEAHGHPGLWQTAVCGLLQRLANLPLPGRDGPILLSNIVPAQQRREMQFYHPLAPVSAKRLAAIFARYGGGGLPEELPARIGRLSYDPTRGFMRGFMDLVMLHGAQTYLIDWKSNNLGAKSEDYAPERLQAVIASHLYGLQYSLYTLALHRYLRLRKPDYRYERDFGGVFFLFLRGINPQRDPALGVHAARPPAELIAALEDALLPQGVET